MPEQQNNDSFKNPLVLLMLAKVIRQSYQINGYISLPEAERSYRYQDGPLEGTKITVMQLSDLSGEISPELARERLRVLSRGNSKYTGIAISVAAQITMEGLLKDRFNYLLEVLKDYPHKPAEGSLGTFNPYVEILKGTENRKLLTICIGTKIDRAVECEMVGLLDQRDSLLYYLEGKVTQSHLLKPLSKIIDQIKDKARYPKFSFNAPEFFPLSPNAFDSSNNKKGKENFKILEDLIWLMSGRKAKDRISITAATGTDYARISLKDEEQAMVIKAFDIQNLFKTELDNEILTDPKFRGRAGTLNIQKPNGALKNSVSSVLEEQEPDGKVNGDDMTVPGRVLK